MRAFYERDPVISQKIQESYRGYKEFKVEKILANINIDKFVPGLDINMMYREMYLAAQGYLWEIQQKDSADIDIDKLERDFTEMLDFWKKSYIRETLNKSR